MNQHFFEEVDKDEAFLTIIKQIEIQHGSKMKRIPRTAIYEGQFHCTILLENYEMLEVTITAGKLGHMAALECEVEVF
jgi:hypothetical protein